MSGTTVFSAIEPFLPWFVVISLVTAIASMVLVPILIVRMPASYFAAKRRVRQWTVKRAALYVLRNMLALVLAIAGVAMLFLPGQGILTLIIGLMMSDIPGKYKLERWLVKKPGVFRSLNWIRERYGRVPLKHPD